ncbi:hypothetical protein UFOVP760_137 [uncultured Caudovirales phage]|uniref:Uncharacterized protein n=1 Tax=uncultured Caudovirales phage TaxID=2100421 RepID=A0A6J7X660_9CAUD|nr:hypothetical protein UFOVP760_137 [uncultured Caudovirales phage]
MNDELNSEVGTLLDQLQTFSTKAETIREVRDPLKKEDLEKFTIEKGGELVQDALDMVATVKDFIISAPNAEDVESLAGLIKAASSAIDTLNHLAVANKRSDTSIKLKEMDISSKRELQQSDNTQRLLATREEIFKMLADKAAPIEVEVVKSERID